MTNALELTGVTKRFATTLAVDHLDLKIPSGCIYGFLGPNGAGKTTTIRMIMSILYPDEGQICVLGNPDPRKIKDRLGYLPEEKGLYEKMTVLEIATYFGTLKGMSKKVAKDRATHLLRKFGLGEWIYQKCQSLSKGMGQKVQIISTLIHEPELVILDEPFSGLDPVNMELVRDIVLEMRKEGRTVIFSTHVMAQAEQMCDYIMLINGGQKVLDGTLAAVKGDAGRAIVIDYDGDSQFLQGLPGVTKVSDAGKSAELQIEGDADTQAILAALVGKLQIHRFDTRQKSLHEIFIEKVKGGSHEPA